MSMEKKNSEVKNNKISTGLIISNENFKKNPILPAEISEVITNTLYYLLIFISREDVIKITCFPSKTNNIKKVLIKLKEFSPELVKGISSVLKELNLSKDILHTTGLCYEMENCFYETYLVGDDLMPIEQVKEKFMEIPKVINVDVEDIPLSQN